MEITKTPPPGSEPDGMDLLRQYATVYPQINDRKFIDKLLVNLLGGTSEVIHEWGRGQVGSSLTHFCPKHEATFLPLLLVCETSDGLDSAEVFVTVHRTYTWSFDIEDVPPKYSAVSIFLLQSVYPTPAQKLGVILHDRRVRREVLISTLPLETLGHDGAGNWCFPLPYSEEGLKKALPFWHEKFGQIRTFWDLLKRSPSQGGIFSEGLSEVAKELLQPESEYALPYFPRLIAFPKGVSGQRNCVVGTYAIDWDTPMSRCYWCSQSQFDVLSEFTTLMDSRAPEYCLENLFNSFNGVSEVPARDEMASLLAGRPVVDKASYDQKEAFRMTVIAQLASCRLDNPDTIGEPTGGSSRQVSPDAILVRNWIQHSLVKGSLPECIKTHEAISFGLLYCTERTKGRDVALIDVSSTWDVVRRGLRAAGEVEDGFVSLMNVAFDDMFYAVCPAWPGQDLGGASYVVDRYNHSSGERSIRVAPLVTDLVNKWAGPTDVFPFFKFFRDLETGGFMRLR